MPYTLEQIQNDPELSSVYENQSEEGKKNMLGENYVTPSDGNGGDGEDGGGEQQKNNNDEGIKDILNAGGGQQKVEKKDDFQQQQQLTPDQRVAQMRSEILNEMFGDRFKTFEEAQLANIPQILDDVETLRQSNTELQTKLEAKPKNVFVNDDMAKFNEFVKDTGISNYNVFNTLNTVDINKMDNLDALVAKYIVENPEQSGKENEIRLRFERKYKLNILKDKKFDEDDEESMREKRELEEQLADNKFQMDTDARLAKNALLEMKGKIKMPEFAEEPTEPEGKTKEEIAQLSSAWKNANPVIVKQLSKVNIPLGNTTLSYDLSEDEQKEIGGLAYQYAVENQLELNAENAKSILTALQKEILFSKFGDITKTIAERVSKMTEQEQKLLYHNPSAKKDKNTDAPPTDHQGQETNLEESQRKAMELEGF